MAAASMWMLLRKEGTQKGIKGPHASRPQCRPIICGMPPLAILLVSCSLRGAHAVCCSRLPLLCFLRRRIPPRASGFPPALGLFLKALRAAALRRFWCRLPPSCPPGTRPFAWAGSTLWLGGAAWAEAWVREKRSKAVSCLTRGPLSSGDKARALGT